MISQLLLICFESFSMFRVTTSRLCEIPRTFPRRLTDLLPMLSVTYIMPVLVLVSVVGVGIEQCMIQNQNEMH